MSITLLYNGATDLWPEVVMEGAEFSTLVNGVAGEAKFRYRDEAQSFTFTTGKSLLLTIDGVNVWRGFVSTVSSVYAFDAYSTTTARFWDVTAADINILFTRRIVFNQSTPANVYGTLFSPDTHDDTAIADLIANFLDLSGDGLDTSTLVDHVGSLDPAQPTRAWSGGWTWANAMDTIRMLPAAIYYIDPDLNLVYCDVDTTTAAFGLSDQPDHSTTYGYREMEVLADGALLANDVMGWGFGYGSQTPVFDRITDATSVSTHGLWQQGSLNYGVYKQTTINRIVDSIVNGSPLSKRGAKNDRPAVMCVTYQGGLRAAQKVDFTSAVFGYTITLPIRKMVITFDGFTPRYELTLSNEIDPPWSFFDVFRFNLNLPPISLPPIGGLPFPPSTVPCALIEFDSFLDRTLTSTLGNTSGDGRAWTTDSTSGISSYGVSFSGVTSGGFVQNNGASSFGSMFAHVDPQAGDTWATGADFSFRMTFVFTGVAGAGEIWVRLLGASCDMRWRAGASNLSAEDDQNNWFDNVSFTYAINTPYIMEGYAKNGIGAGMRVYAVGGTPPAWVFPSAGNTTAGPTSEWAYDDGSVIGMDGSTTLSVVVFDIPSPAIYYWYDLQVSSTACIVGEPITSCSFTESTVLDDFNRTPGTALGTATCGYPWTYPGASSTDWQISSGGGAECIATLVSGHWSSSATLSQTLTFPGAVSLDYTNMDVAFYDSGIARSNNVGLRIKANSSTVQITANVSYNILPSDPGGAPLRPVFTLVVTAPIGKQNVQEWFGDQSTFFNATGTIVIGYEAGVVTATADGHVLTAILANSSGGAIGPLTDAVMDRMLASGSQSAGLSPARPILDNLDGGNLVCGPVGGPIAASIGTEVGFVTISPQAGSTVIYEVGSQYFPGSTRVTVNGTLQIPGTDYTESDPVNGLITFTSAPGGAVVQIWYISAGQL